MLVLQLAAWKFYSVFKKICLWETFQSGGSEDVVQLLEDCWSESRRGRESSCYGCVTSLVVLLVNCDVYNFCLIFLHWKSVGALVLPQVQGSSTMQGRSSGHRQRNVTAGVDGLQGGVYTTCYMLLGVKLYPFTSSLCHWPCS